jgi:hypothetical protein
MERLRKQIKNLREGLRNQEEDLRSQPDFGIVIAIEQRRTDPGKVLIVYFGGRYHIRNGKDELIYESFEISTDELINNNLRINDLIRIEKGGIKRLGTLQDIQGKLIL